MKYIRNDGKVTAELVFDNGETACYHASWTDPKGREHTNRFTTRTSASFKENFNVA